MDPLTVLLGLGQIVPGVLRWFGRDNAAEVADKAVSVVKSIGAQDDYDAALAAVRADPALVVRLQETLNAVVLAQIDSEVRQLEAINATMRAEYASNDPYVRRARPTWLYVTAASWAVQAIGLFWAIVAYPERAGDVIKACAEMTAMWGIALSVVGVAIKARSDDKARSLGQEVPTALDSVARAFRRG